MVSGEAGGVAGVFYGERQISEIVAKLRLLNFHLGGDFRSITVNNHVSRGAILGAGLSGFVEKNKSLQKRFPGRRRHAAKRLGVAGCQCPHEFGGILRASGHQGVFQDGGGAIRGGRLAKRAGACRQEQRDDYQSSFEKKRDGEIFEHED